MIFYTGRNYANKYRKERFIMSENNQAHYQEQYPGNQQPTARKYQGGLGKDYTVDMVFCIDATGSMEDFSGGQKRIINMVKENALSFYGDLMKKMADKNKRISQLRVRVIAFRDYIADGENAMLVTDFFRLPEQAAAFESCINSIHAAGGGDIPEDGLEALAYAMKSSWTSEGTDQRRVIVVWTDAGTHPLGFGSSAENYPKGMPANLSELGDWWDDIPTKSKRLVLYAPDEPGWSHISANWENVVHYPSVAGNGLAECDYSEILDVLAMSITK